MKKKLSCLLALTLVGTCAAPLVQTGIIDTAMVASAATTAAGLEYTVSSNSVTITKYTGSSSYVAIPAEIDGKAVTAIGNSAFLFNTTIRSINIPDSVTSIGDFAFYGCDNLTTMTLSKNIRKNSSGGYLFSGCPLTNVTVNGEMSDPSFIDHFDYNTNAVIYGYKGYLRFELSESTKEVTITGYTGNGGEVEIPDYICGKAVTTIGSDAFRNNRTITSFKFGNSVTTIKDYAFNNLTALKTMTLSPNLSTKKSGGYLFNGCDALKTINVPYEMKDSDFVFHFRYLNCFSQLMRTVIDKRVETVYNELKASNPSLNWNILGLQGEAREKAKYEVAKYIHSRLGNGDVNDPNVYIHYINTVEDNIPYCLVTGKGTCAGMSSSYVMLLRKAGFSLDEIDLIGAPQHQLAGVKLFGQWYLVECTNNATSSFAMHFNGEWYRSGTYNGVTKISSDDVLYQGLGEMYTKNGTVNELNAATQAYLADKYGKANGGVNTSVTAYKRGDVNMDGSINSADATKLRSYINGYNPSGINLVNCDVNRDGSINNYDLNALNNLIPG